MQCYAVIALALCCYLNHIDLLTFMAIAISHHISTCFLLFYILLITLPHDSFEDQRIEVTKVIDQFLYIYIGGNHANGTRKNS